MNTYLDLKVSVMYETDETIVNTLDYSDEVKAEKLINLLDLTLDDINPDTLKLNINQYNRFMSQCYQELLEECK
ncbi:hypothetical protein OAQ99_03025 [Candidatus Kapabacteria bacterium]|nr:hypothetical protein [Candidatus Kapabacteria bacterium]